MKSIDAQEWLTEDEVRRIVRLLGGTAAVKGGHAAKKRYLMDGLCSLVNADAWAWTLGTRSASEEAQRYVSFLHGGFDEERFSRLLDIIEHPKANEIGERFDRQVAGDKPVTTSLEKIAPIPEAHAEGLGDYWEAADINSIILSGHPLDEQSMSVVALYRPFGVHAFSERDQRIAHVILTEVPWLHQIGWPEDRGALVPRLFPRQRMALNLLLEGHSRKMIAERMDISESTVAGYTKDIYRHFGVNSQVELVRKFFT